MKKIGIYTSGGDAPGMNSALRAAVRTASGLNLEVVGIKRGYNGMINSEFINLDSYSVANIIQKGGTILKTARSEEFRTKQGREKAFNNLQNAGIEGLICIGGNGSYTGAHFFYQEFGIPIIGLPGTIDNDIYGTDYSIGYDTAINTAIEAIDKIRDTAESHDRIFVVEVMGRHSGYIALEVGLASGAEAILVPEIQKDTELLHEMLQKRTDRKKIFSIIVVAEGDEEGGALEISKIIKEKYPEIDVRPTILGHIQRGGNATARDRILASRLGASAVQLLLEGEGDIALGLINNRVVKTPFEEAISKKNQLPNSFLELASLLSR